MSHEIRTPMAAKRNGEHLLELINDILDLSRIEAGKLDVDVQPIPLPQLVADIQSLMTVRAEAKKVQFDTAAVAWDSRLANGWFR